MGKVLKMNPKVPGLSLTRCCAGLGDSTSIEG